MYTYECIEAYTDDWWFAELFMYGVSALALSYNCRDQKKSYT